ncbi:Cobalamin biosynthesis protein CbiG [hydrothermal vent metagenome]|uniref:Cobalamin biosynthesis protein CbiG n=1 Tax=hydrothermal vent metagenome TaxID=652676 RepID=A0A160VB35_9ZZZZ|tara:strand:+ start:574 stop:1635 length:1062 start_codon:yes stop_codon:yes gene_type:complete
MARTLAGSLDRDHALFIDRRFRKDDDSGEAFDLPLRPVVKRAFAGYSSLVLFLSAGASIRLLAPLLESKQIDPAVVCVDDAGSFCVSLISGHVGGADQLAQEVAVCLGARAVVTSASHASGTLAVDLLGREFGWRLKADATTITRASAAVINGQPIGIWQGAGEPGWWPDGKPLPENIAVYATLEDLAASACATALIISDTTGDLETLLADKITVVYRPRSLVIGMGCRRGVPVEELESLLAEALRENGLSAECLAEIATAEIKRGEPGLEQLAERHRVPLSFVQANELNGVFETNPGAITSKSERAHGLVGVWGVAEPAALLTAGASELLVNREKTTRATIAIARKDFTRNS